MAEDTIRGLHDRRARVTFFLPLVTEGHENAIRCIIKYLDQRRDSAIPVTGYTYSALRPAAFIGCWWDNEDPERKLPVEEDVVCFIVD